MAQAGIFPKSAGDTAYAQDYNLLRDLVGAVLVDYYGQTSSTQAVSAQDLIDSQQWQTLVQDLDLLRLHQSGATTGIALPQTGDSLTAAQVNLVYTAAQQAEADKNSVSTATQLALVTGVTSVRSASWTTTVNCTITYTWDSEAAATYFFNAGGYLTIGLSAAGGGGGDKDLDWSAIIAGFGGRTFTRANWLTTGTQTLANLPAGAYKAAYSANTLAITALRSGATVAITTTLADTSTGNVDEAVTLTITAASDYYRSVAAVTGYAPTQVQVTDPF